MKRRQHEEKKPNHERWLITYADMITLLMVFFIVMYALSNVDANKFRALAESLSKALGGGGIVLTNAGPDVVTGSNATVQGNLGKASQEQLPAVDEKDLKETANLALIKAKVDSYIKAKGLNASVTATLEERGVVISFKDAILFKLGSAELTPQAKAIVRQIGEILLPLPNYIRIEGHTDNLPINTSRFPSNWELSTARATSVVHELIDGLHFPPYRLSAVGYGEYRPKVPNTSEQNRQKNRRVDIVILRSKYEPVEPKSGKVPGQN
ncbi:OmpA/MotB family protein [Carboxydothermus hydrogenoformans]|uniref:Flagellar motor protein MotB n=1 Tax=Carboxydothermus hydrogenoformans (strain ATCC BAA-161 / DSM 6008 / Z-2901) TaxID=246194 RepID=Q3ADH3_CARHZ|nr:flagellar motor protein MotB [Carboxydothermus hydrogenoformans]ABB14838.1 flagellar motor protein MotB [Carboxydothermus hydrogenoformans Z-2901]